jgi:hypothetical protein
MKWISLILLFLMACSLETDFAELNSAQPVSQKSPFEPLKIYSYCPDGIICYLKTPNTVDYKGMWCTRDQDLVDKYCEEHHARK